MTRREWELTEKVIELENALASRIEKGEIREMEIRSLRSELELKTAYSSTLEQQKVSLEQLSQERMHHIEWLRSHLDHLVSIPALAPVLSEQDAASRPASRAAADLLPDDRTSVALPTALRSGSRCAATGLASSRSKRPNRMISYAQNAEDVVLARALPWSNGFYVDVGAADAEVASVTKYFYELGWHGINIDPRASSIASLSLHRPRDLNLRVAVGAADGTTNLYLFEHDQDLSTTDPTDRDLVASKGHEYEVQEIEVRSLDSILREHDIEHIDFLKVDVEGGEAEVLAGIDLQRWRPRVVIVEATEPWSHKRRDDAWRPILQRAGYAEGGFDGINVFFAHSDDPEVLDRLAPASVLDVYKPAWLVAIEGELEKLRAYVRHLEEELQAHRSYQETLTEHIRELEVTASSNRAVEPLRSRERNTVEWRRAGERRSD